MATRCAHTTDICAVCGLCSAHCVGHTSMLFMPPPESGHAPLSTVRWGVRTLLNRDGSEYKGPHCQALLRLAQDRDGTIRMVQVGRADTRQIPEEERESQGRKLPRRQERKAA